MKKVLIIAPRFFDYGKSIEKAFNKLGLESRLIEVNFLYQNTLERIRYYSGKDRYFEMKKDQLNAEVLRNYEEIKPDLVFMVQAGYLYRDTLLKMKDAIKSVWMMDTIKRNKIEYPWDIVDHIFFFEKTDIEVLWELEKIDGRFLPLALDESVYYPMPRKEDIDLLFVGALYDDRVGILKEICRTYPDRNIQVYGIKNEALHKRIYHRFFREHKKSFRNRNIPPATVNELYSRSKICLNIHHPQNKHGVNQRFFEVPGSGSFQLVNNNDYISSNFTAEEIMTFNSRDELMEQVNRLLNNEVDIRRMAENAYKKIISQHTFTHRMSDVLHIAQAGK